MNTPEQPWSVRVSLEDVPETGLRVELDADPQTRLALAKAVGVNRMDRLHAHFDVTRRGRDGLRAVGRVAATVQQNCVVSLEPVTNDVVEDIDLTFSPRARSGGPEVIIASSDGVTAEDPPEPLVNGEIDLGAVATEFLILGIDPYPRKPGVVFEGFSDTESGNKPFAQLAALRRKTLRD